MGIGGGKRLAKCLITSHSRGTAAGTPLKLRVFIAGRNRLENPGECIRPEDRLFVSSPDHPTHSYYQSTDPTPFPLQPTFMLKICVATFPHEPTPPHELPPRPTLFVICVFLLGAIALAEAFGRIGTLEEVQMPQNGIYHPGITALSEAFAKNPNMRHINLNDNTFTAVGAKAMAENALPILNGLQVRVTAA